MANTKLGNHPSWAGQSVEKLDSTKQLGRSDSGKVFMIDNSGAFTINLPKLSADIAGWNCKMIIQVDGSADVSVVGHGLPAAGGTTNDSDSLWYRELSLADEVGTSTNAQDGFTIDADSVKNDSFDIFSDGTSWYVTAIVHEIAHSTPIDS